MLNLAAWLLVQARQQKAARQEQQVHADLLDTIAEQESTFKALHNSAQQKSALQQEKSRLKTLYEEAAASVTNGTALVRKHMELEAVQDQLSNVCLDMAFQIRKRHNAWQLQF